MDNQANATPRPWKVSNSAPCRIINKSRLIAFTSAPEVEDCEDEITAMNEANASLIVKAVNNHDTLLFYAKDYLKRLEKKDPNSITLIEGLRQAIAKAEGR